MAVRLADSLSIRRREGRGRGPYPRSNMVASPTIVGGLEERRVVEPVSFLSGVLDLWDRLQSRLMDPVLSLGGFLLAVGSVVGILVLAPWEGWMPVGGLVGPFLLASVGGLLLFAGSLRGASETPNDGGAETEDGIDEAPDPRWPELARRMRAILHQPYQQDVLGDEGSHEPPGLLTAFRHYLSTPGHDIVRDEEDWTKTDEQTVEARKPVYDAWRQALRGWRGHQAYEEFVEATQDLDRPITREEFERMHELFVRAVEEAIVLNEWMVQWLGQHLGRTALQVRQWHRDFVDACLVPFMEEVESFERRVQVELGETSTLLEEGLGPFDYESARRGLPHLEPISMS